ncbi:C-type lectin-like, partial [Trinorchestia longiramus]
VCALIVACTARETLQETVPPIPSSSTSFTLEELQGQLDRLRVELYLEKRFRVEVQSLASVNAENLRRLERSLELFSQESQETGAHLGRELTRLQRLVVDNSDYTELKQKVDKIEESLVELKRNVREMEVSPALLLFQERSGESDRLSFNLTQTVNSLAQRVTANEEYQVLLQTSFEEAESSFHTKLKRKFRNLKNDLDSRIRDYNAALTTFASDIRILRQEMEQNVINIQTNVAVDGRKVSDAIHVLETKANQTKDEFQESLYYLAKAQQEQIAYQEDLALEVVDLRQQTDELRTSLQRTDSHVKNISSVVQGLRAHQEENYVEGPLEAPCPDPYLKWESCCFYVLEEPLSWDEARQRCRSLALEVGGSGDLATARQDTHPVRSFVRNNIHNLPGEQYVWVGASSSSDAANWTWVGDTLVNLDLFPWGRGEPDPSADQPYLCVKVSGAALFHNCLRSSVLHGVCEL